MPPPAATTISFRKVVGDDGVSMSWFLPRPARPPHHEIISHGNSLFHNLEEKHRKPFKNANTGISAALMPCLKSQALHNNKNVYFCMLRRFGVWLFRGCFGKTILYYSTYTTMAVSDMQNSFVGWFDEILACLHSMFLNNIFIWKCSLSSITTLLTFCITWFGTNVFSNWKFA